jgi:hypothetical protein
MNFLNRLNSCRPLSYLAGIQSIKLYFTCLLTFVLSLVSQPISAEDFPELEVQVSSGVISGLPVSWGNDQVLMLRNDGWLAQFPRNQVIQHRLLDRNFQPAVAHEMSKSLLNEIGGSYQTAVAGPFLIVAPGNSIPLWSDRFLQLYNGFRSFCSTRQIPLREPSFLMPAIVFRTREEFEQYAQRYNNPVSPSTLGYYSLLSNRIVLYDLPNSDATSTFYSTASTLIHEATHQTAYNTGIHDRLSEQPLWVVEGLAMLFEAPGIYDSDRYPRREMRINKLRRDSFKHYFPDERSLTEVLPLLITDDKFFEHDPDRAYCLAWALTFYLSEKSVASYASLLRQVSSRGSGSVYPANERFQNFEQQFGDLNLLARDVQRFIKEL